MLGAMSYDKPYAGLRVLEIGQGYAAPYCAMMLAQYGAEVIKVEPPAGDWSRGIGTWFDGHTALSIVANLGKKNLALDLKAEEGQTLARRLAARCDVLVEAARPGVAARLGMDYQRVRADNPGVIYVSVSGFGQDGPYAGRPCTDTVMQSFSGLMSVNLGLDDAMPHRVGCLISDHLTGLYAFQAVAAALYGQRDQDQGRFIDVSLMASTASLLAMNIAGHHLADGAPRLLNAPAGTYATSDGWIALAMIKESDWVSICACLDRPDLATDPRFADFAQRAANLEPLLAILRPILRTRSTDQWAAAFEAADVLYNRINDFGDWLADDQVRASGAAPAVTQPGAGPTPIVHIPGTAPPGDGDGRHQAPLLGEHSREILADLGLDDAEIEALATKGVTRFAE